MRTAKIARQIVLTERDTSHRHYHHRHPIIAIIISARQYPCVRYGYW